MRARSFRRRLDRLERSINKAEEQNKDRLAKFTVDPALVKALRDDHQRLWELNHKEFLALNDKESKGLTVAEMEEKARLDKRIAENVKLLHLPPEYGEKEAELDRRRLDDFRIKHMTPRARFSEAEVAEEAQLRARVSAFEETPEGRGRKRIHELARAFLFQKTLYGQVNAAEQNEYDRLTELYPPVKLPPDPRDRVLDEWRKRCGPPR